MALKGELASGGLAAVFQMLALNGKKGLLSIAAGDDWRGLYFEPRGITLFYDEEAYLDQLLDALVAKELLKSDALADARQEHPGDSIGTVDAILDEGELTEDVFQDVFESQMREQILDLFNWHDAHWEFIEGGPSIEGKDGVINENFFQDPDEIANEAARRLAAKDSPSQEKTAKTPLSALTRPGKAKQSAKDPDPVEMERSARQRSILMSFAILICLCVLGGLYILYDSYVMKLVTQLEYQARPYLSAEPKEFRKAIAVYQDFLKQHPLSFSARKLVREEVNKLEDAWMIEDMKHGNRPAPNKR